MRTTWDLLTTWNGICSTPCFAPVRLVHCHSYCQAVTYGVSTKHTPNHKKIVNTKQKFHTIAKPFAVLASYATCQSRSPAYTEVLSLILLAIEYLGTNWYVLWQGSMPTPRDGKDFRPLCKQWWSGTPRAVDVIKNVHRLRVGVPSTLSLSMPFI